MHGGPGGFITDQHLQMLAPLAEAGYEVYLYDQIGSGRSARLANIKAYTPERHRSDLEAIVEEIGAAKVILLGQSWGTVAEYMQLFANHQLTIIPDAGHAIAVEQPALFSATMLAFLQQGRAGAANASTR